MWKKVFEYREGSTLIAQFGTFFRLSKIWAKSQSKSFPKQVVFYKN